MRLHQVVGERIAARGESLRSIAARAGIDAGNLSRFLSTGRGIGVEKIDRLLALLDVRFAETQAPASLAWLDAADHWHALLRPRLPDLEEGELRQIIVSILRPLAQRRFILRRFRGGHAL